LRAKQAQQTPRRQRTRADTFAIDERQTYGAGRQVERKT